MSTLSEIAETLAVDFTQAVRDAEKDDVAQIEEILDLMNRVFQDYMETEQRINSQIEQAKKQIEEAVQAGDINATTYNRRIADLREKLAYFKQTKISTPKLEGNVVKIGSKI